MFESNRTRWALAASVVWLGFLTKSVTRTLAASGDIYNLGTLGGPSSSATAVNAAGQVTGYSDTGGGPTHAFLYTGTPGSGGAMADLGTLLGPGGGYSQGFGINALGQVTGSSIATGGTSHAFLYTGTPGHGGVMQDLGTLGGHDTTGFAVNASGKVTGVSEVAPTNVNHQFIYTGTPGGGGTMQDLGTGNVGHAINASGQVTGGYIHAFLYSGGTTYDLGTLGGFASLGYALNDSGQIVGDSGTDIGGQAHAFLYTGTPRNGGVMHDLGALGGNGFNSLARGINNGGDVVGINYNDAAKPRVVHPFLYVGKPGVDGHMIDLSDWLKATNPAESAKWTLNDATGISDTGLIVGTGIYDDGPGGLSDGTRAFLLDASSLLPEPSGLLLIVAAGGLLLRRRAHQMSVPEPRSQ